MARIDWVIVSDLAFFDRHARLCMVGIATHLVVPSLPVGIPQIMVVARVVDPLPEEEMDVGVAVLTPTGTWAVPDHPDSVHIEVAAEYVLVTIRDLPLTEEGTYTKSSSSAGTRKRWKSCSSGSRPRCRPIVREALPTQTMSKSSLSCCRKTDFPVARASSDVKTMDP